MMASSTLERLALLGNVTLFCDDGSCGYSEEAPYERICVSASAVEVPEPLLDQLTPGGKLIISLKSARGQELALVTRTGSAYQKQVIGKSKLMPLKGECVFT
jgi:protein-L-isoaspartate(D-aspartate) O-methyltransferase